MSVSCVTMMMVMPCSRLRLVSSSMISRLVLVSRLPVGSSASRTVGSVTMARAMATRCCWPPESSLERVMLAARQPDARAARRAPAGGARLPACRGRQRQLDILDRRGARQQVEALEDEAEIVPPQQRALVAVEARRHRRRRTGSRPRSAYRGSRGCSWRSTCRSPDGPMIATNSPADAQIDAGQRMHRRVARAVDLGDAVAARSAAAGLRRLRHRRLLSA